MSQKPVTLGLVGVGGFGGHVLNCIRQLEVASDPLVKLTAVCEPMQEANAQILASLRTEGVTVVADLSEMLKLPVQALWMPIPIPLHRAFACRAMEAGKWVICEKPAAGSIQDVDAMIATRDRMGGHIAIAYQDIHEPAVPLIKQELLGGAIGRIERLATVCCWPRGSDYFGRNNWAGRARSGDTWVLDSPCMNAMAHYINLPLFLLGASQEAAATPRHVSAELYRAREIETADTCAIRVHTAEGATALFLMTHACDESVEPQTVFHGSKGRCVLTPAEARFELDSGQVKVIPRQLNVARTGEAAIARWTGRAPQQLVATLELARIQVLVVNAAFDAAEVKDMPASAYEVKREAQRVLPVVHGIQADFLACAEKGLLPSEAGVRWASPGGGLDLEGYIAFRGTYFGGTGAPQR